MTSDKWKKLGYSGGICCVACLMFSYGLSTWMKVDFWAIFPLVLALPLLYFGYLAGKDEEESEEVITMRETIANYENVSNEQFSVIKEYEDIFDAQLVELPCLCGGNTFKGLFSPNLENLVECEKCHNKYRVEISYNSVLISEPMDRKSIIDTVGDNTIIS